MKLYAIELYFRFLDRWSLHDNCSTIIFYSFTYLRGRSRDEIGMSGDFYLEFQPHHRLDHNI